ncbi:hypothetical protein vBRpoSV10_146 [Ruegeria phage vB_RpoS-V10]|nr:hypothetical protein vBRpoSV10_146 [Ruegeria phage vB_RpoS-V10]
MQIAGSAVEHAEKHHAYIDGRSARTIRGMIRGALKVQADISASITDEDTRKEFDEIFAEDVARAESAAALMTGAMEREGASE